MGKCGTSCPESSINKLQGKKEGWKDIYRFKKDLRNLSTKCNKWTLFGFWLKQANCKKNNMSKFGKFKQSEYVIITNNFL